MENKLFLILVFRYNEKLPFAIFKTTEYKIIEDNSFSLLQIRLLDPSNDRKMDIYTVTDFDYFRVYRIDKEEIDKLESIMLDFIEKVDINIKKSTTTP